MLFIPVHLTPKSTSSFFTLLHRPPEIVCVKVPRELGIDVDHVHIALCRIPDDSLVVLARCLVGFDIDAECAVELQLESVCALLVRTLPTTSTSCRIQDLHSCVLAGPRLNASLHTLIL